jgi:hypothetical protein
MMQAILYGQILKNHLQLTQINILHLCLKINLAFLAILSGIDLYQNLTYLLCQKDSKICCENCHYAGIKHFWKETGRHVII